LSHPDADVAAIAMELERPRVDRRPPGPRDGRLRGNDVQDVHPPRRPVDDLEAAVTADRHVVIDDRVDVDAEVVERAHRAGLSRDAPATASRGCDDVAG